MTSLRSRFLIVLAALVAAASLAGSGIAYATTDHQLADQLDGSIERAAAQLTTAHARPQPAAPPPVRPAAGQDAGQAGGAGALPLGNGAPGAGRADNAIDLVIAQQLGAGGKVVAQLSSVSLPVTAADRAIAAGNAPALLRTEQVDGTPYRVITVGLPRGGAVQVAQSLGPDDRVLGALRWQFGLIDGLLILLAALAGWLIARRITTPLEQLTDVAEEIAGGGALDRDVPAVGRDEVGRLGRSFAAMLRALQRSKAQQQQLVRDAGHELRTPLTSIRSNIDLLRRHGNALPTEAMDRLLGDLDLELRELTGLVEEVVDLAADSRTTEPIVTVQVEEVAATAAERLESRFGRDVIVAAEPWSVQAPRRALERAVSNLLENAVKFDRSDRPIELTIRPGVISVRDHGAGFDNNDLPLVFDRFYRAGTARSLPGSGLGLSIVRQVAEDLGGTAWAENHPDGGALVRIELPLDPVSRSGDQL